MSYVIQAVLSNAQHPEYGQVTILPIPNQNYDCTIGAAWNPWRSAIRSGRIVR